MPPLQYSLDEAWVEGFLGGFRQGVLQSVALQMKEKKIDPALISEITKLSMEEVQKLKSYGEKEKS